MKKTNISFYLNGELIERQLDPESRVLDLLRDLLWLTGTKEGCGDGDCGACTITLGYPINNKIKYEAVNSCLMPVGKLQGTSIITIEGIDKENNDLNIIQEAMIEQHGLQCGFCSPGVSMNMFSLLANHEIPSYNDMIIALNGNICRCTGYEGIRNAAKQVLAYLKETPDYDVVPKKIRDIEKNLFSMKNDIIIDDYLLPNSIESLKTLLKNNPEAMIICGCSDISAKRHITKESLKKVIDVSRINEMTKIELTNEGLSIGAANSLTDIINNSLCSQNVLTLCEGLKEIAAIQVRNLATLAGNIVNASPIADGVVLLMALSAKLIIVNENSKKEILLKDFYKGYKKTVLKEGDVITNIIIPKSSFEKEYHFIKTAKRNAVDIATVNSCASFEKAGEKLVKVEIAFGGIAETVKLETLDLNRDIEILARDISSKYNPLSDVRGSSSYRAKLIKNHIIKHFAFINGEL